MQHTSRTWVIVAGLSLALLTAGCKSGGGGLSSLFGIFGGSGGESGGGESGGSGVLASLIDVGGSGGGTGGSGGSTGGSGGGSEITSPAATVHNPEPGSIALFGTGLLGVAFLRRRKSHRA